MSDTPRTDKRCADSQKLQTMAMRFAWMCDFARTLERENAGLRDALDQIVRSEFPTDYRSIARAALDAVGKEAT